MGYNQLELTRELSGEKLFMTTLPVTGTVFTDSGSQWVTDSAAAASAMATGQKIVNHTISQDVAGNDLPTLLELFSAQKKLTGLVVTSEVVDATPAAFFAHVKNRKEKEKIAEFFLKTKVDVILGGGKSFFLPKSEGGKRKDNRNLIQELKKEGYQWVSTAHELSMVKKLNKKLLGLFNKNDLHYWIDHEEIPEALNEPSLLDMTQKALVLLSRTSQGRTPQGFFLMVEGSRIDHASHHFDVATMAEELKMFDRAIASAVDFAKKRNDTLIIVTADHETGGLTPSEDTHYDYLRTLRVSAEYIGQQIREKGFKKKEIKNILDTYAHVHEITEEEMNRIKEAENKDEWVLGTAVGSIMANRAGVSTLPYEVCFIGNTKAHTSLPVPLFGYGPSSMLFGMLFGGVMHNTDIPKKISKVMHVSLRSQ